MHLFQSVRIQLGLLLAQLGADGGFLRFDHGQRLPVVVPEHIIRIADAGFRGLMLDFLFLGHFAGVGAIDTDIPADGSQFGIDQPFASGSLVKAQRICGGFTDGQQPLEFLHFFLGRLRVLTLAASSSVRSVCISDSFAARVS